MPAKTCCACGLGPRQGVELRPYGPQGAPICFPCARSTPERQAEAQERMRRSLGDVVGPLVVTESGLQGAASYVQTLRCGTCGKAPTPGEVAAVVETLERVTREQGGRPPELDTFMCEGCTAKARRSPPVCVECAQPIALEGGAAVVVGTDGRARHPGRCPDWLGALEATRGDRRLVDARATDEALERLEQSPEAAALLAALGGTSIRGDA